MAAHIIDRGEQDCLHVGLPVNVAGNLGHSRNVVYGVLIGNGCRPLRRHTYRIRQGHCRRNHSLRGGHWGRSRGFWRRRHVVVLRHHAGIHVQRPQFLVAILFPRKQLLDPLQPLHRLRAHAVLQKNLCLQHEVFEHGRFVFAVRAGGFIIGLALRRRAHLDRRGKAVGDSAVAVGVNLAAQHLQALLVPGLIGIDLGGGIE